MGTISGKQLDASLEKAKYVGMVEEPFTMGDAKFVLRNLRPDEYEAIVAEAGDADDGVSYLNRWQKGHVCRSIVEVNDVDLRHIDFVEVEEPDPKDKTRTKLVKKELHDWILKNIMSTWGKEGLYTVYRKFTDVLYKAETESTQGVVFLVPEETGEDKFRRLAAELKAAEDDVPPAIVRAVLEEYGYTAYTKPADEKALEDLDQVLEGQEAPPGPPKEAIPTAPPPAPDGNATDPGYRAAQLMRQRVPLSQQPVDVPSMPVAPPPPMTVPAARADAPLVTPPPAALVQAPHVVNKRTQEIASLEEDLEFRAPPPQAVLPPGMALPPGMTAPTANIADIPKVSLSKANRTDVQGMQAILNQPPRGVMNPKFKPQGR